MRTYSAVLARITLTEISFDTDNFLCMIALQRARIYAYVYEIQRYAQIQTCACLVNRANAKRADESSKLYKLNIELTRLVT